MRKPRGGAAVLLGATIALGSVASPTAFAEDYHRTTGHSDTQAVSVYMKQGQVSDLPASQVAGSGAGAGRSVSYEYDSSLACVDALRGTDRGSIGCTEATSACTNPAEPGPLRRLWRRDSVDGQVVVPWRVLAVTCAAGGAVPGARPAVTLAMVQEAFHRTPWASVGVGVQPVGGVTLVNLETFFAASWSSNGFAPGQVDRLDPGSMLGYQVEIRPRLVGYTYSFGDGVVFGPTPNAGGPWPSGGVRHVYKATGAVSVGVSATVGADFRIDGGAWAPIPDTVTLTAAPVSLSVKQARAVLINP